MALKQALLCATAASVCLLSGQSWAADARDQQLNKLEQEVTQLEKEVKALKKGQGSVKHAYRRQEPKSRDMRVLGHMVRSGVTISTTPFLGIRNGQVLYNVPSMNEDLLILKQRGRLESQLNKLGTSLDKRTLIGISGALEGAFIEQTNWRSKWQGSTDLNTAEIDVGVMAGNWVNAFFSITYNATSADTGSRLPNNQLYLQRGFLTIGNLLKSPFYFSIGQMYVPYGRYASAMITTPLTRSVGRISARAAVIGFSKTHWFAQLYGYNSHSRNVSHFPVDEGGVNIGGQFDSATQSFHFGVGTVSNLADSQGSLDNGEGNTANFRGFNAAGIGGNYKLRHNVAAVDAYANYSYRSWNFIAEFLTAVRKYSPLDMYYGSTNSGARPAALHTEINYNTHFFGKPATAAITYGQTWQSLAMNLPRQSVSVLYDVQVWRRAAIGVEFRHDINYKNGTQAGGASSTTTTASLNSQGSTRDIITMRFGVYF